MNEKVISFNNLWSQCQIEKFKFMTKVLKDKGLKHVHKGKKSMVLKQDKIVQLRLLKYYGSSYHWIVEDAKEKGPRKERVTNLYYD